MLTIKRKTLGDFIGEIIIYIVLTILSVVMVIPFIYVIAASFAKDANAENSL